MDLIAHSGTTRSFDPSPPQLPAPLRAPALRAGDRIHLCAASYPTSAAKMRRAVAQLRKTGYRITAAANATQEYGYLAGQDQQRADELNAALADPKIHALAAVRGGYGAMRILDRLDFSPLLRHPKLLLGYSDFTVLLMAAYQRTGIVGFHGPMPAVEIVGSESQFALENLHRALRPEPMGELPLVDPVVLRPGSGAGPLLGGCLSLLAHLSGSGYLPSFDGAVLFWEEIGESPYRIDRMLTQLRLGGHLSKLAALIVGGVTDCVPHRPMNSLTVEQIVLDVCAGTSYPILTGLPVGHIPRPITVPIGVRTRVEASASGASVVVEEAATVFRAERRSRKATAGSPRRRAGD